MFKGWGRFFAVVAILAALGGSGMFAAGRIIASDRGRIESVKEGLEHALGAHVTVTGSLVFEALPRPRIVATGVEFSARGGTVVLSIPMVQGNLSVLPTLGGRIVFSKVKLINPTGIIDADALAFRARHGADKRPDANAQDLKAMPDKVVVSSGLIEVRSSDRAVSGVLTDLHTVVEGLQGGAATLSGGAAWHGERGEFSARFESIAALLGGRTTTGFGKLRTPLLSASVSGTLADGWRGQFSGNVTASTSSVAGLMRLVGIAGADNAATIQHASFSGIAETTATGIAFANSRLTLNGTVLEGTLAWQNEQGRSGLTGTLATDLLDLDPLLAALPETRDGNGRWSNRTLDVSPVVAHDLDLRISANRVKLNAISAEDAALSVLCQDGRMELSLGEARAYGGLVKGRLFTSGAGDATEVRADASWSRIDIGAVGTAFQLTNEQVVGSATGHMTVEGRGRTVEAIVSSAGGYGQASLRQGRLSGFPVIDALLQPDAPGGPSDHAGKPIDLASLEFKIDQGLLRIETATVAGPNLHLSVKGRASLPERSYALSSTAAAEAIVKDGAAIMPASLELEGRWGGPIRRIEINQRKPDRPMGVMESPHGDYFP